MASITSPGRRSFEGLILGLAICLAATMAVPSVASTTVTYREGVSPTGTYNVQDADIRSGTAADTNQEGNIRWNAAYYGTIDREVAGFPLSPLPAGATVTSVTIDVFQNASGSAGTQQQVDLHTITNANFTDENTVTWNSANTGSPWTTPGGDFDPTVLSSVTPVGTPTDGTEYTFGSSPAFIAAVNSALAGDGVLRLLMKQASESGFSLVSFYSSDGGAPADVRPELSITYSVPEPATLGPVAIGGLAMLRRRRETGR